jgi:hypothetical protein
LICRLTPSHHHVCSLSCRFQIVFLFKKTCHTSGSDPSIVNPPPPYAHTHIPPTKFHSIALFFVRG